MRQSMPKRAPPYSTSAITPANQPDDCIVVSKQKRRKKTEILLYIIWVLHMKSLEITFVLCKHCAICLKPNIFVISKTPNVIKCELPARSISYFSSTRVRIGTSPSLARPAKKLISIRNRYPIRLPPNWLTSEPAAAAEPPAMRSQPGTQKGKVIGRSSPSFQVPRRNRDQRGNCCGSMSRQVKVKYLLDRQVRIGRVLICDCGTAH